MSRRDITNRLFLGDLDDRCVVCGTNLRTPYGVRLPCPIGHEQDDQPEDAA
jgi:hypothetical protein